MKGKGEMTTFFLNSSPPKEWFHEKDIQNTENWSLLLWLEVSIGKTFWIFAGNQNYPGVVRILKKITRFKWPKCVFVMKKERAQKLISFRPRNL